MSFIIPGRPGINTYRLGPPAADLIARNGESNSTRTTNALSTGRLSFGCPLLLSQPSFVHPTDPGTTGVPPATIPASNGLACTTGYAGRIGAVGSGLSYLTRTSFYYTIELIVIIIIV